MEITNNNYRILNLEGAYIVKRVENKDKVMETKFEYSTADRKVNKIYTATMPYSLEIFRAFNLVDGETWETENDKFTSLFINLKFTKNFFCKESKDIIEADGKKVTKLVDFEINKKDIRTLFYTNVIKIDDIEYCFF